MLHLFKYKQGEQLYYSAIAPLHFILEKSEILIYGENEYGYQRALVKSHYRKISKQLVDNINNLVSPTSIILGVDEEKIEKYLQQTSFNSNIYEFNEDLIKDGKKLFRVVDGQHRLKGMEEASYEIKEINDYPLNVIIMVLKSEERRKEVDAFSNINSKAKKLKTDLTRLATYKYDIIEREINETNIENFLLTTVCKKLNDNDIKFHKNVWVNGIKLGVNEKDSLGIVSLNTFSKSIKKIVDFDRINNILKLKNKDQIFMKVDEYSTEIANIISQCWEYVSEIWESCFEEKYRFSIYGNEEFFYKDDYYLQKTMGTLVINELISESKNIENFIDILKRSEVSASDWKIGGKFSGLSSMSGKNYIYSLFKK